MTLKNKINGFREIWKFDNRLQLISNRLFFSGERINIYRYRGLEILVDHSAGDANGARELIATGVYDPFLSELQLDSPINVLDFGSNNGGFPLLLKARGYEVGKVVALELNPRTFVRMRFNIDRNFDCETVLLNAALCGENCEIETVLGEGSTADSIYASGNADGLRVKVPGLSFDEVVSRHFGDETIDVCKMDIEGAEFEVFSSKHIQRLAQCRYLLIEIHHGEAGNRASVLSKLANMGFKEIKRETQRSDEGHLVHLLAK